MQWGLAVLGGASGYSFAVNSSEIPLTTGILYLFELHLLNIL